MNEIVIWARQWPAATINPIQLLKDQAYDKNRARRNRFYEQFGLIFDYDDDEGCAGMSRPMPAGLLTPVCTWNENLRVLQMDEFIGSVLHERNDLAYTSEHRGSALAELMDENRRASRRPIRWCAQRLWEQHRAAIAGVSIMIALTALFWWRYIG